MVISNVANGTEALSGGEQMKGAPVTPLQENWFPLLQLQPAMTQLAGLPHAVSVPVLNQGGRSRCGVLSDDTEQPRSVEARRIGLEGPGVADEGRMARIGLDE